MARKRKSKPTSKRRNAKQKLKDRYAHAREDAQLAGLIPTTPEEALKSEVVDPATQGEQSLPGITRSAMRRGWAVPEHLKPALVDEMVDVITGKNATPVEKVMSFNALTKADKDQWTRDNPELAGKTKGATKVEVSPLLTDLKDLFKAVDEQRALARLPNALHEIGASGEGTTVPYRGSDAEDQGRQASEEERQQAHRRQEGNGSGSAEG